MSSSFSFGATESSVFFTEPSLVPTGLGFQPDGKAWILTLFDDFETFSRQATANAILYEEVP